MGVTSSYSYAGALDRLGRRTVVPKGSAMRTLALSALVVSILVLCGSAGATSPAATTVVVERGEPLQIAFASDLSGFAQGFGVSLSNAIRMALEAHPRIKGFDIQLNVVDAPCGEPAADAAAAAAIVANSQNVGVLGQVCSFGFAEALPVYEAAGLAVITGSATRPGLSAFGPSVFNRTIVDDDGYEDWFPRVDVLPSVVAWRQAYEQRFGVAPLPFAEFYFDAASLLLRRVQEVSRKVHGDLVIDRAELADAIRRTVGFRGVTCSITLDPSTGDRSSDLLALDRCSDAGGDEGDG
jgi:ABC-type branched-subunit amino acid transport system substrate-binding protein